MGQCNSQQFKNSQDQQHILNQPVFHIQNPRKPKFCLNGQFIDSKNELHNERLEKEAESSENQFMVLSFKSSVNLKGSTNLDILSNRDFISTEFRTRTRRGESPTDTFHPISLRQVKVVKNNLLTLAKEH